jgi:hypothetical protein
MKDLFYENCKTLKKEVEEDTKRPLMFMDWQN